MNLSTKQKQSHGHRDQTVAAKGESSGERNGLGVWDWETQMITFRTDQQQGPND